MIILKDLTIGYDKNHPIVSGLNHQFGNEIYGIMGESGTGKTTLLRTIAKLNVPLSGDVINSDNGDVYMMHQNYTCFDWLNCRDNILITIKSKYKRVTKDDISRANEVLDSVGLGDYILKFPYQLSGGMRQRLALARTIFMSPSVILMDEPLSALDEDTRKQMQNIILDLHKRTNNTIIMVTHSKEDARTMCDRIITIRKDV